MAGGLPKGLLKKAEKSKKRQKNFRQSAQPNQDGPLSVSNQSDTGKSLSEALLFAEHGENMLFTKIFLNVRNNFCTQHVLPRFEFGIFMYLFNL